MNVWSNNRTTENLTGFYNFARLDGLEHWSFAMSVSGFYPQLGASDRTADMVNNINGATATVSPATPNDMCTSAPQLRPYGAPSSYADYCYSQSVMTSRARGDLSQGLHTTGFPMYPQGPHQAADPAQHPNLFQLPQDACCLQPPMGVTGSGLPPGTPIYPWMTIVGMYSEAQVGTF